MRKKVDKMVSTLGGGLLGYYLGLSILRDPIWRLLERTLPPINNRHLPREYTGIVGAVIGLALGYLLFVKLIEKCSLEKCKKQYALGLLALLLLPPITMLSFRSQAVNYVRNAEATTPTEFNIRYNNKSNVYFALTESSATGSVRSISVVNDDEVLQAFGEAIQQLELVVATDEPQLQPSLGNHYGTVWITYRPQGRWYSKILTFGDSMFQESVTNHQTSLYKGTALVEVIQSLEDRLKDLSTFTSVEVLHTSLVNQETHSLERIELEDFQFIMDAIRAKNIITPSGEVATNFESIVNNGRYITKEETHYYAFSLNNQPPDNQYSVQETWFENVILYDHELKIAWFEGEYYQADFSSIIVELGL